MPTSRKQIPRVAKKGTSKKAAPKSRRMTKVEGHPAVGLWLKRVKPELQPLVCKIDEMILAAMPDAVCAVKWGVPFYGLRGQGWITAINSFKAHVKLLFFRGSDLKPALPAGKNHNAIDFRSEAELAAAERQVKAWLRQASELPGWLRVP